MLQCISVLTEVHSETNSRERLTETSNLSICAEVGGGGRGKMNIEKSLTSLEKRNTILSAYKKHRNDAISWDSQNSNKNNGGTQCFIVL